MGSGVLPWRKLSRRMVFPAPPPAFSPGSPRPRARRALGRIRRTPPPLPTMLRPAKAAHWRSVTLRQARRKNVNSSSSVRSMIFCSFHPGSNSRAASTCRSHGSWGSSPARTWRAQAARRLSALSRGSWGWGRAKVLWAYSRRRPDRAGRVFPARANTACSMPSQNTSVYSPPFCCS